MPKVEGTSGPMNSHRRDEPLSLMPANKIEARLPGALIEMLYRLVELGDVPCPSPTLPACS
jgi:hypothetical protein